MHDTGCLGLVHWDDPDGWNGEGGGRRVQDGSSYSGGLRPLVELCVEPAGVSRRCMGLRLQAYGLGHHFYKFLSVLFFLTE